MFALPISRVTVCSMLFALLTLLICADSYAACSDLDTRLASQRQTLSQLETRRAHLEQMIQGQIDDDFVISKLLPEPLDETLAVLETRVNLTRALEQQAKSGAPSPPDAFADCPQQADTWQSQAKQINAQKQVINRHLLQLYQLPAPSRRAVVRATTQWQAVHRIEMQVNEWAVKNKDTPSVSSLSENIIDWIQYWRDSTQLWLGQLVSPGQAGSRSNEVWNITLQVPDPQTAIDWNIPLPGEELPTLLQWLDGLEVAQRTLVRGSSIWRNQQIRAEGWGTLLKEMQHPTQFWYQLRTEILSAPINLADAIARPFIREYRRARQEGTLAETLASWFLQSLSLVAVMSILLKLASAAPQALSKLQQRLMTSVQHKSLLQLNSALLWLLKPNSPWLVVFLGSNLICHQLPERWIILQWLAPIGTLYAAFRAVRVMVDLLIARTFTRSGQFVSSQAATQHTQDAQRVSWIVLFSILVWIMVQGTGGGYLMFIMILLVTAVIWGSLLWLLLRYREAVARFLLYAVGKGTSKKLDPSTAQRWWMLPLWPLLFLLAHLTDTVVHLHQKALVFDTYRSVSVKIMRIRLAAEAKEEDEEPDDENSSLPDESYSDWMQRNNKAWVDAVNLDKVLQPITEWHNEKSESNVLLIVGDQGSGKSALLDRLGKLWTDTPVSVLSIPAKTTDPAAVLPLIGNHLGKPDLSTVAELVKLDDTLEPRVVVLDNTHNLFLSEVGHLNAYRVLSQCLNARLDNIFWIVVMHAPSWTYLSCVFNRELRFSHVFRMPRWSPADIRKLILSRHQGSRRRIRYDELLLSASAGSESSSVRAANSRIFNILWEQSGGNPQVAIQLWLKAARSKDNIVEIGVPSKPSGAPLKTMKDDMGFVFAAIVIHKSLTSDEIIGVTHFPEAIVRHALKQGLNLGLLVREEDKRYRIHPAWQGTLSSYLASKNLLWDI